MSDEPVSSQQQLLNLAPEKFEQCLLIALDANKELWYKASKHLCISRQQQFENHFSSFHNYVIYRALYKWRELMSGTEFAPISEGGLINALYILSQETPPLITDEQVLEFTQLFLGWRKQLYPDEALTIVKPTWRDWLMRRKSAAIFTDCQRSGMEDVDSAISDVLQTKAEINKEDEEEEPVIWDMTTLAAHSGKIVERMPLSNDFRNLNENLGGGLGKTEHVLFIAPTGGGKTVLACQLAVDMALSRRGTLLLSTEQHPKELYPRVISNISYKLNKPIPNKLIKDGINERAKTLLTTEQLNTINEILPMLPALRIGNWTSDKTIADIPSIIEAEKNIFQSRGLTLDCIVLDWIGGALTESTSDGSKRRLLMLQAAEMMKNLAIEHNIATVSFAQTNAKGIDVHKVTEQHIAECKNMHHEATAAFGVSAVRLTSDDNGDVYDVRQHIYGFKTRKGKGTYFTIKRNFDYQRFENC